ncbi:MAG: beta-N-acetylhexosaminidase [Bacteroidales bacterium]|nr:beta-N-acetylhexosaminidase [Bacteroidales bacterium]
MKRLFILFSVLVPLAACAKAPGALGIVPAPKNVTIQNGSFKVKGAGFNIDPALRENTVQALNRLADDISVGTGRTSSVALANGLTPAAELSSLKGFFFLCDPALPAENYRMEVGRKAVKVTASDHNGFLYAIQTLRQMLPVANYAGKAGASGAWRLPCCIIEDGPQFAYRGMHLDACRHFWSVEETKKYLDVMAMYKLNRLHWHLTEDQGWRIEIKKYPELTETGAFRNGTMVGHDFNSNDGIRYGGYYTQEQIKDIVAYAGDLGITVIPEIDLPGHMQAALATYPELGCTGGPYDVWTIWGVSEDVLCVGKDETFTFLENVLDEICELFPSEYIHIGGDECPKVRWENCPRCQARIRQLGLKAEDGVSKEQKLQNYVTSRIQKYLEDKGRKIIGWDEILEGDLDAGATVMSWRGTKGGIKAAGLDFDVIMTPTDYFYFDYQQGDPEKEPLGPGYIKIPLTMEKVYSFNPFDQIDASQQKHIIGVQANLWTEYIATPEHLEYMLLPRMLALAEVQWCKPEKKDYARFENDVRTHQFAILDILGYKHHE